MTYKGTQRLGEFFSSRRERGIVGISTLSVTIDNGVVERNSIARKMETNLSADEHLLGKSGDIAYNMMRMWQGASGFIEKDGLLSPAYTVLAPKQGINSKYAAYLFKSPRLIYLFWAYSYGLTNDRLRLYFNNFIRIPVEIPPEPEQAKIANFLTAIDEKITQLTQKHDLLKQYKKGAMQQIFSQKLLFKDEDGRDFPEWEAKRLGDVATFHNGRAYKQSEWEDNGLPVIRLQNLTGSSTNFYYSNIQLPENQYCNNGDLLYMWSATFGPVWWYGDKAIFHYHIWKIETESMRMSRNYLYYVLDDITAKMKNTSNGSTMAHITKEGILKRAVQLPCVKEQTKIANFLTAIDDKITHTQTQLDAVKLYKKGLLQQLFV